MKFGEVLDGLIEGKSFQRTGWNGKNMFIYYVQANSYPVQTDIAKIYFGENALVPYNPYLAIKNVDETVSTWVPSINDLFADDWEQVTFFSVRKTDG